MILFCVLMYCFYIGSCVIVGQWLSDFSLVTLLSSVVSIHNFSSLNSSVLCAFVFSHPSLSLN